MTFREMLHCEAGGFGDHRGSPQAGIDRLAKAGKIIGYLNEEFERAEATAEGGYGFGQTFTDEEIRANLPGGRLYEIERQIIGQPL